MRLDHLLSKEHLAPHPLGGEGVQACRNITECVMPAAHGWNIEQQSKLCFLACVSTQCVLRDGVVGTDGRVVGLFVGCTLLGPGGPDPVSGVASIPLLWGLGWCLVWVMVLLAWGFRTCCRGSRDRPYVENYTVDASIFEALFVSHYVV